MSHYLIGIDAGTSVIKAALFDLEGNEIHRGARNVPITNPTPTQAEENMEEVWVAATEAIQQCLQGSGVAAKDIKALSLTGQGDGTWMIDKDGKPIGPAILWTDGRAGALVDQWYEDGTVTKQFQLSGTGPYAGTSTAVLRWLKDNRPESLEGATQLWCKDWIGYGLTGVAKTDPSDPSLGGIDVVTRNYNDEVLDTWGILDIKDVLPEIIPAAGLLGTVTAEAAGLTGLPEGLPVYKGQMDITASSLGVGVINPGDCMAVVGTAGIVTVATDDPANATDPEDVGWMIPHTDKTSIRAMGMSCCTPNLDWFLREFGAPFRAEAEAMRILGGDPDRSQGALLYDYLDRVVSSVPVGSNGVIFHGYLSPGGERAPFTKADARGSFSGLNMSHTRADMLRAVYEGVALGIRDCLDSIPIPVDVVRMSGGGANSPVWAQIFADCLGRKIVVPAGTEFGAKGAAIVAGIGSGEFASYDEAAAQTVHMVREYTPNPENTAKYDKFFAVYRKIRVAMLDIWGDLAEAVRAAE
ncbi:FGGY-family carbohydrate kinase [Propionicicella superfundia]|uniref:FGGY-family carbohydrate kinase n=1 Tax=Propionicicella superfundia TaxID=348582 RepID=UPI0004070435|nr:FGGY-family carbohydrate kinase [Propionicicella superfundia]